MLELKDICKTFNPNTINAKVALNHLNLTLNDGDFVTVIGGNGAGKSTMLNAIAGVFQVDSGTITIDGQDVTKLPEHKRAAFLGRVFQDPMMGTAPTMQIEENLALAARRGQPRGLKWGITALERADYRELLKTLDLGLEDRLTAKVGLLSGGQRQALTLLMASLKQPKLLLLDEHTAALDPKTADKVLALSDQIVQENNLTTLMITHNMKDAIAHGNRLIMMDAGRVVVDNIGIYDKVLRGVYAASYSLLCDATAYPVINGAVFYLDDFPSPVPGGDGTYIRRDYSMSIADFYAKVWWPDLMKLAQKYSIRFTGVMIENYEDDTMDAPTRQPDTQQFRYFGSLLLRQGGEVGYHGYNHQPLVLPDTDYKDLYSYRQWPGEDAIVAAMDELIAFQKIVLPHTDGSVYVPPSNILSAAGRQVLGSKVPQIRTIASTYFEDDTDLPYVQEFGVASDGMVLEAYASLRLDNGCIKTTGLNIRDIRVGSQVVCYNSEQLDAMLNIVAELDAQGCMNEIAEMNLSMLDSIYLVTTDSYVANIGDAQQLRPKIGTVRAVVTELRNRGLKGGMIEATVPGEASYRPVSN